MTLDEDTLVDLVGYFEVVTIIPDNEIWYGHRVVERRAVENDPTSLADGPGDEPAYRQFWSDRSDGTPGPIWVETRSRGDRKPSDGRGGQPAIRRFHHDGVTPQYIERFQRGVRQDSADGQAAYRRFTENGVLAESHHYQDGKLQDPDTGIPAERSYNENGTLVSTTRRKRGLRCDGANGEPAVVTYWANGRVRKEERFTDDVRCDGANGQPAIMSFDDQGFRSFAKHMQSEAVKQAHPEEA